MGESSASLDNGHFTHVFRIQRDVRVLVTMNQSTAHQIVVSIFGTVSCCAYILGSSPARNYLIYLLCLSLSVSVLVSCVFPFNGIMRNKRTVNARTLNRKLRNYTLCYYYLELSNSLTLSHCCLLIAIFANRDLRLHFGGLWLCCVFVYTFGLTKIISI